MQVRVLRLYPAGSSAYGVVEAEIDGVRKTVGLIGQAETARRLVDEARRLGATLIVRTELEGEAPSWMPGPRGRFAEIAAELERTAGGVDLCVWPTAAGVISDVPSVLSFRSAEARGARWGLLLDPVSMMTPGMLARAEDHADRVFDSLAAQAGLWGVLLADADERENGICLMPLRPLGSLTSTVVEAWRRWKPQAPTVLLEQDLDEQTGLL